MIAIIGLDGIIKKLYIGGGLIDLTSLAGSVPSSRTLTINSVTYDLSANRTWTIPSPLVYQDGTVPAGNTIANQSGSDVAFTSSYTILANTLAVGSVIRIKLQGVYGTATIAPLITAKLKIGATTFLTSGILTSVALVTNGGWTANAELIVTAIGGNGSIESQGYAQFATAATTGLSVNLTNLAVISLDTTINKIITVTINWNTSDTANTITLRTISVDILNT